LAEVLGVGALNWDRVLLVDRLADPGEEIVVKKVVEEAGGSAANTIAALARLGVSCSFIGRVGRDVEGEGIIASLEREGVVTRWVSRVEGSTGCVYSFVDERGERSMYVSPGVNNDLGFEELKSKVPESAKLIHASSFAGGMALDAVLRLPEVKGSAMLSFAPGFLSYEGSSLLRRMLPGCDVLFLNEKEARALTGRSAPRAAKALHKMGVGCVAVTTGSKGCVVADENGVVEVGSEKVRAVDTTGAGDAFAAGFIFGLLKGFEAKLCGRIGNYVASRCIGAVGARKGLPTLEELKKHFPASLQRCV